MSEPQKPDDLEAPPPVLGSWRNLYAFVLATLGVVVLGLWLVTRAYS